MGLLLALSLFITIDEVQLKNTAGEWVTVVRPDSRVDLAEQEPAVRFFNNGRIPAGEYTNVRVRFTAQEENKQLQLERVQDYSPPVLVGKGTFIGVSFLFDRQAPERLSAGTVKEVRLTAGEDERVDTGDRIRLWS